MVACIKTYGELWMGRRKSISDDAVLAAAELAMAQYGPGRFTLAIVAAVAGLSPATLMQRFGDKRGLILRVLRRSNDMLARDCEEVGGVPSFAAVLDLVCGWAEGLGDGAHFSEQMQWLAEDTRDGAFQEIARARFRLMRAAIAARLPETVLPRDTAIALIEAQWHGVLVRWGVDRDGDLQHSLRHQLEPLMDLLKK